MASEAQIAANRRNAQKSTGPRTPEGKAAVRFNSLRHGLYASATLLPGENQSEFDHLCLDLRAEWQPHTPTETYLAEQLAVSHWTQARLARSRPALLEKESDPLHRFTLQDKMDQYLARLQRGHSRALKELRSLQKPQPAQTQNEHQEPQPTEAEEQFCQGVCWLDGRGHAQIISPPARRDADGNWHPLPQSEWTAPEEWNLVEPPTIHPDVLLLLEKEK